MSSLNPLRRVKKAFGLDEQTRFTEVLPSDLYEDLREVEPETIETLMQLFGAMEQFNAEAQNLCASAGVSERHIEIQKQFQQVLQDVERMASDKPDSRNWLMKKLNKWSEAKRGDVSEQFENIKKNAAEVVRDVAVQVKNERTFVDSYYEVHLATREAKVLMEQARERQNKRYQDAATLMEGKMEALQNTAPGTVEYAQAELAMSESQLAFNRESGRRSSAEGLTNGLTETVAMCEAMLMHLRQTTSTKEELYRQTGQALQSTQSQFTLMTMSITSQKGMLESTRSIEELNQGREATMKHLAKNNVSYQERALKAAHSRTIDPAVLQQFSNSILQAGQKLDPLRERLIEENRKSAQSAARISEEFKTSLVSQSAKRATKNLDQKKPAGALSHLAKAAESEAEKVQEEAPQARSPRMR